MASPYIKAIEYYLPGKFLTTSELAKDFPGWPIEQIDKKTGIDRRPLADTDECSSDLALSAARKLFSTGACSPSDVDFLLLCTQSPDYVLPPTSCLLQDRLGLSKGIGALDFSLGCSGFVYGLGLAAGLIASGQACNVLLLTAETYSKYIAPQNRSCRSIFGDGAAATLVHAGSPTNGQIGPFLYGTDGSGGQHLIVPNSGSRRSPAFERRYDERTQLNLRMDGPKLFEFALDVVPNLVKDLLGKSQLTIGDISLFVFHQANGYMLEALRSALSISKEKFFISMAHSGNTVSSTIPIALKDAFSSGRTTLGGKVMIVGFGVGLSWAGTIITFDKL